MKKIINYICPIIIVLILIFTFSALFNNNEIKTIKNEKDLYSAYSNNYYNEMSVTERILLLPFSLFYNDYRVYTNTGWSSTWGIKDYAVDDKNDIAYEETSSASGDFSTTNIQVEGVDEADIIKTDGNYIYSISNNKVIITNAKDPNSLEVASTVDFGTSTPIDLVLYKNNLVVISSSKSYYQSSSWYYESNSNTLVTVYNIKDKENPNLVKTFELYEPYNTSRCIDGNLYIFASGQLRVKDEKVIRKYIEDGKTKEIDFKNIKYINNEKKSVQTLIAELDLNDTKKDLKLSSYLIDMFNAYVSKDNIYLVNYNYGINNEIKISNLFTLKGIFGVFEDENDFNYSAKTKIYKFNINNGVKYSSNTLVEGTIVNQYSLDEKDGNLRIAVETDDGTQVVILDNKLNKIGETDKVAYGEKMYASRFMGDKAYLVTYENTDPLFVIDLSDPHNPSVLGELKIPGYSTYLHPYDDTHLIGIGMDTEEVVNKDLNGNVYSRFSRIVGMKMALFDVSNVNNPKEVDSIKIGDSRTVSAVLTNPKALLFSKEKNLIAIPVNNLNSDFSTDISSSYESDFSNYTSKLNNYVSEGYLVYDINLDGFNKKGIIVHDKNNVESYYSYNTKLLRGLYINDNLYTVSEDYVKVNKLSNLSELYSLNLKGVK